VALADGVEAELVRDLGGSHGIGKVLLVGENQQDSVAELILLPAEAGEDGGDTCMSVVGGVGASRALAAPQR